MPYSTSAVVDLSVVTEMVTADEVTEFAATVRICGGGTTGAGSANVLKSCAGDVVSTLPPSGFDLTRKK